MTLPSTATTNLWSDFKSTPFGPFPRIVQVAQALSPTSGNQAIGSTAQPKLAQSFIAEDGELFSADFQLRRVNTPTDEVTFEIYEDNSDMPTGALVATGSILPANRLTGVGSWRRTVFFQPPATTPGTKYWFVLGRTGALGIHSYALDYRLSNPYASGKLMAFNGTTWADVTDSDASFKVNFRVEGRYQLGIDKTNNKVRMFKSTDSGNTWSEMDASNAPGISSTVNLKSINAQVFDKLIYVYGITSGTRFDRQQFNTETDTWGTQQDGDTSTVISTNISGAAPIHGSFRITAGPAGRPPNIVVYNGAKETVMGSDRDRIKMSRGPTYGAEIDVVGSGNTPDATLPGTAVNHHFRAGLLDPDDVIHFFWTQSDDSNVRHRQWNVNDTFSTANLLGSTPATTSNSVAYSISLPANYYRDDAWNIALPVVASDSNSINMLQVPRDSASTQNAWASTVAVSQGIEVSTSNPCVVVPDNEQGGRLYLFFVGTDDKLYFTHDGGNDIWRPAEEFRPGVSKTITALSAMVGIDDVGIVWLDTVPTPDAILFDRLDIYFEKMEFGTGTYESIRDFGVAEQVSYMVVIDVDELAATSYLANFYTRETESDSWGLMNTLSAEEADTNGYAAFVRSRYVKVEITITGGTFPSGVFGYEN